MLLSSKISQILSILGNDIVIIEGMKDREALNKFGINNLIEISGRPLFEIADSLAEKNIRNVAILTDFDKEGECKKSHLSHYLSHYGIKINSFARKKIKTLFKIHKIEELTHFTKFMDGDYTGEASPVYDKIFDRSRIHNRWRGGKTRRHRSDFRPN